VLTATAHWRLLRFQVSLSGRGGAPWLQPAHLLAGMVGCGRTRYSQPRSRGKQRMVYKNQWGLPLATHVLWCTHPPASSVDACDGRLQAEARPPWMLFPCMGW
jgi:hypothetical protein